jgi:predicted unusual protein kinase regulating ubiquinone biosynthesis (AarF/ABC1/UbiB family)
MVSSYGTMAARQEDAIDEAPMARERKVPEGRLARLSQYASLGARATVGLLTKKGGAHMAEQTAQVLGNMRGLAAKVGQIASYVDGLVPETSREVFEGALSTLRAKAATSPIAEVRALVEEELGAPIEELFTAFDPEPFASASIGQVHRAELAGGREVAVKVQHPGIGKAVESDLKNTSVLEPIAAFAGGRKVDAKQIFDEMAQRLREELDYALEAERQEAFRALHAGDPKIRVPAVVRERSSKRVLVTELAQGATLDEVAARSEVERRAFARTLWRFVYKGNLVGGMFNADPHPGNYLFGDDGVVTFLDFGCVEPIPPERLKNARGLHRSAIAGDEDAFAEYARKILHTRGGKWEELAVAYSRRCFEPLFASPFRITRPFAADLVGRLKEIGRSVRQLPNGESVPVPRGMVFMNRLQAGFYSVLARLDVEVDYADVERGFLGEAGLL